MLVIEHLPGGISYSSSSFLLTAPVLLGSALTVLTSASPQALLGAGGSGSGVEDLLSTGSTPFWALTGLLLPPAVSATPLVLGWRTSGSSGSEERSFLRGDWGADGGRDGSASDSIEDWFVSSGFGVGWSFLRGDCGGWSAAKHNTRHQVRRRNVRRNEWGWVV